MSDDSTNTDTSTDESTATTGDGSQDEPKTFDADYVSKLRAENAKHRTEAKANADAAKRLAEIEESQKTETQKLTDAKAAAESDALQARADALRWRTAAKFGISDEDAETFLTGTDEEALTRQAERLAALSKTETNIPGPRADLSQGARGGSPNAGTPAQAFEQFLKGQQTG